MATFPRPIGDGARSAGGRGRVPVRDRRGGAGHGAVSGRGGAGRRPTGAHRRAAPMTAGPAEKAGGPVADGPDLESCDREPIHLLGAVQGFGFLLAADADGTV